MKTILVDAWNTFVTEDGINQEMYQMLETFDNPKIILTNADAEKQIELGLGDLPYPLFTQNFNPLKTNPEFYKNLLDEYDLKSEDVVYFEHDEKAVDSARSEGIESFYYNKDAKDIEAVKQFLLNNI